jgi:DNA-3-methyladenine glycosylase
MNTKVLSEIFYQQKTIKVARALLGKTLIHKKNGFVTSGVILETEAYLGEKDRACHTFGGRKTPRVKSMYQPGGCSYVYFIYGIHFCFNVVTGTENEPEAVLIRSLLPLRGIDLMKQRRHQENEKNLCSGPGKLCQALGIDRSCDGLDLQGSQIWIEDQALYPKIKIEAAPRVGIDSAGEAKDWLLRFYFNPISSKLNART